MKNKYIKSIALGLGLISVSACSQHLGTYNSVDAQKRNIVQHVRLTENIDVSYAASGLATGTKEQINLFLRINQVGYGDKLSLDLGQQANANAKRSAVRKHLLSQGFILEKHAPITGSAPRANHGLLIVDRFILTPPNCNSTHTQGNSIPITINSPSYGCSSQVNLGVMVANPQDLVEPQQTENSNTEVSVAAVSDYRNNAPAKGTQIASPLSGGN